jgi:rubrerythrin
MVSGQGYIREEEMETTCVHSCKGLCQALELAEHREEQALQEYRRFVTTCDYPDVKLILEDLIGQRERALELMREKRKVLAARFSMIDNINESFL